MESVEGKRSVIKKIMEKDEISTNHFIFVVGEIITQGNVYHIELTDGWYSVYFEIKSEEKFNNDRNLITNNQLLLLLFKTRKLYPGLKIHVMNMKLQEGKSSTSKEEGVKPERILADIAYNSICPAPWDAKLGATRTMYTLRNLVSMRNNGGLVSLIDVFVLRKYKVLEKSQAGVR